MIGSLSEERAIALVHAAHDAIVRAEEAHPRASLRLRMHPFTWEDLAILVADTIGTQAVTTLTGPHLWRTPVETDPALALACIEVVCTHEPGCGWAETLEAAA